MASDKLQVVNFRSFCRQLSLYIIFAMVILFITPFVGAEKVSVSDFFKGVANSDADSISTQIVLNLRIPRIMLGFIVGGTLALVGSVFQVILKNPLAEPYTLGVTGGAAVGAVLAISFPVFKFTFAAFTSVQVMSLVGSILVLGLIYLFARRRRGLSMNVLLLAGVTIGIFCGALILLIRYISNPDLLVSMDRWIMGALDTYGYSELGKLLPLLLPGLGLLFMQQKKLNHLALGDEMALSHGVDIRSVQTLSFVGGSLATASVVSFAGPIGFVGLIIPHIVRKISGFDHILILPASFLVGGSFLVLCDTIARTVFAPTEMPVGIITALIGGPFFIYLLIKN